MSKCLTVLVIALACLAGPATASATSHRPTVTGFAFSPASFSVPAPDAASGARAHRVTTIHFQLSRRATVRISISRTLTGRRSHGRCVAPTKALRGHRACTRHDFQGSLTRKTGSGAVTVPFSGILHGRALKVGRYHASIVARARNGRHSRRNSALFKVTRAAAGPAPAPAPAPAPSPPLGGARPSPSNVGVPAGWVPTQTLTSDLNVRQAGAVIQDVDMIGGSIIVSAPNVTIRRVRLQGGKINNFPSSGCGNGMVVEDTTIGPAPGQTRGNDTEGVISYGGYTARRVLVNNRSEGPRVGGSPQCGPVTIEDSFIRITSPIGCNDNSWHGDGIQGYGGGAVTIRNSTVILDEDLCHGTAPFFYPKNQGNTSATIDGLMVQGGGYAFRDGMPGTVNGLKIVNSGWIFGPVDVNCAAISSWNASIVNVDANYQVTGTVRQQSCTGVGN
jgi:hypothetical protein